MHRVGVILVELKAGGRRRLIVHRDLREFVDDEPADLVAVFVDGRDFQFVAVHVHAGEMVRLVGERDVVVVDEVVVQRAAAAGDEVMHVLALAALVAVGVSVHHQIHTVYLEENTSIDISKENGRPCPISTRRKSFEKLIDLDGPGGARTREGEIELSAGRHRMVVGYLETYGDNVL